MTTLTFYTLADFVGELKRRDFGAVRCESLMQDAGSQMPMRTHKIVLTAHDAEQAEVLACTIVTGKSMMPRAEPWHGENLVTAKALVVAHLEANGLTVLPGVYHHEPGGRASCGLWQFDRESKRLVATQSKEASD